MSRRVVVAVDVSPVRPGTGGVGRYVNDLWTHLPEGDAPPAMVFVPLTNRPRAWRTVAGESVWRGSQRPPAAVVARPTLAWLALEAPQRAAAAGAAVFHATTGRAPLTGRPAIVLTVHDTAVLDLPELFAWRERVLSGWWQRMAVPRARRILCVSDATRSAVLRRWPGVAGRLAVTRPGLAPRWFGPAPPLPPALVQRLGPRYWLHVGGCAARKNVVALVEAFGALRAGLAPAPTLALVGPPGDADGAVGAAVARLGLGAAVCRLGTVDDGTLHALYAGAELTACVSHHEGFGLTALEAVACGCPVVSSGRGGLPEAAPAGAVVADGVDAAALGRALEAVAGDPGLAAALRVAGRAAAAGRTWHGPVNATRAAYAAAAQPARTALHP